MSTIHCINGSHDLNAVDGHFRDDVMITDTVTGCVSRFLSLKCQSSPRPSTQDTFPVIFKCERLSITSDCIFEQPIYLKKQTNKQTNKQKTNKPHSRKF